MLRNLGFAVTAANIGVSAYLVSTQFSVPPWGVFVVFTLVVLVSAMVALPPGKYRSPGLAALGISLGVLFVLSGVVLAGLAIVSYWGSASEIVSGNYFPPRAAVPMILLLFASAGVILAKIHTAERKLSSS